MRFIILKLLTVLSLTAAENLAVDKEGSRVYFVSNTSFFLFGSDEIHGENSRVDGYLDQTFQGGRIAIGAAGFDTGNRMRDGHISQILESDEHPVIEFAVKEMVGMDDGDKGSGVMRGVLNIRGHEREIVMNISWEKRGGGILIEGRGNITYSAFGIERPTVAFGVVKKAEDMLEVGAKIYFRKEP